MKLQDRVAIVTGAAQGIGRAVAEKLAEEGATVVLADINGAGAEAAAAAIPGALGVAADVSSAGDVQRMVDETVKAHGKVDVLVNVAAIVPFTAWDDITFEEWRRIMSVNLDGVFLTIKAVEKPMREAGYGRIVNIASNVILAGTPNLAHYVASKGGVWSLYPSSRARTRQARHHRQLGRAGADGLRGRACEPACRGLRLRADAAGDPAACRPRRHRPRRGVPGLRGVGLGDRADDRGRRRAHPQLMADLAVTRAGAILAVSGFERSLAFYRDRLGLAVEAVYDDPPYATLTCAGARISLAEEGHPADDRPGVAMTAPADRSRADVVLVLEVADAAAVHAALAAEGVPMLAPPFRPPWGGCRFFCVDPDGYLVEIEQPA